MRNQGLRLRLKKLKYKPRHNYPYDCVLKVTSEHSFDFERFKDTHPLRKLYPCIGKTMKDFIRDIKFEMKRFRDCDPEIVIARQKLNGKWVDVLHEVKYLLNRSVS